MFALERQLNYFNASVFAEHDQPHSDKVSHKTHLQGRLDKTTQDATEKLTSRILHGQLNGKTVTVETETLKKLALGHKIAACVKDLANKSAPNQILGLMQSGPLIYPVNAYFRSGLSGHERVTSATDTILIRNGVCVQQADVAYLIAQSLDLRAALVVDSWNDHAYILLDHDSDNPVMVDPWAVVPTACLASESPYRHTRIDDECNPGDGIPLDFNLAAIEETRERFERKMGPDAFEEAMLEDYTKYFGIRSAFLDGYCLDQGVMRYDRINTDGLTDGEKSRISNTRERIKHLVQERLLASIAPTTRTAIRTDEIKITSVSIAGKAIPEPMQKEKLLASRVLNTSATSRDDRVRTTVRIGGRLIPDRMLNAERYIPAEYKAAYDIAASAAKSKAERAAQIAADRDMRRRAKEAANKSGTKRVIDTVFGTATHHRWHKEGDVTVMAKATATARVDPCLWNERLTAHTLNVYKTRDGESARFDKVPRALLDDITNAIAVGKRKQYPESYIKGKYVEIPALGHVTPNEAAPATPRQPQDREIQLQQAVIAKVSEIVDKLETSCREASMQTGNLNTAISDEQREQNQCKLIQMLEHRVEHLPLQEFEATLVAVAERLLELQGRAANDAADLLEVWIDDVETDDARNKIEEKLESFDLENPGVAHLHGAEWGE